MAKVFIANRNDTMEKRHKVYYTKGSNINYGKVRTFGDIRNARKFAAQKAKELGCKVTQ